MNEVFEIISRWLIKPVQRADHLLLIGSLPFVECDDLFHGRHIFPIFGDVGQLMVQVLLTYLGAGAVCIHEKFFEIQITERVR